MLTAMKVPVPAKRGLNIKERTQNEPEHAGKMSISVRSSEDTVEVSETFWQEDEHQHLRFSTL